MSTPEGRVKDKIKKILKDYDVYYHMTVTSGYGKSGVPDFVCSYKGRFIGIEAKAGAGKLTALQERHLYEIRLHGGIALVINETNLHELEDELERLFRNECAPAASARQRAEGV
jgi:hypothetical protein